MAKTKPEDGTEVTAAGRAGWRLKSNRSDHTCQFGKYRVTTTAIVLPVDAITPEHREFLIAQRDAGAIEITEVEISETETPPNQ